jgi:hypothetical protein
MSEEPQFFEDGSSLWPLEGGGVVAFSNTGVPIGAQDENGTPLDYRGIQPPEELFEDPDDGYYEPDEIDQLREELENLPDLQAVREEARAMGEQASGDLAEQSWASAIAREMQTVEARIGRPLTAGEQWRIMEESHADLDAGVASEGGIWEHVERAQLTPFSPGMGDNDAGRAERRQAYMGELIGDAEREQRGEQPGDKPWHEPSSDSPHDQRVSQMLNTIDHGEDMT